MTMMAFIPARGGSTGVKKKNVRALHNKPLISHTLSFALSMSCFSKVMISTDSDEIASISLGNHLQAKDFLKLRENEVIPIDHRILLHRRPTSQAQTLSPIRETLFEIAKMETISSDVDYICMLQPTSPFRRAEEIEEILGLMHSKSEWSSIASFTSVGGNHPDRMYRVVDENHLLPFLNQDNLDNKPRQELEALFIKDGAYYVLKIENLRRNIMLGDRMLGIYRQGLCTVNIDTETDFQIAELISKPFG